MPKAKTCAYCKPDAQGHHARNCPNRPDDAWAAIGEVLAGIKTEPQKDAKRDDNPMNRRR